VYFINKALSDFNCMYVCMCSDIMPVVSGCSAKVIRAVIYLGHLKIVM